MANIPFLNNAYFAAKVGIGTEIKVQTQAITDLELRTCLVNTLTFSELDLCKYTVARTNRSAVLGIQTTSGYYM